ncbi:MAG TPA: SAM-dependent methyltransferase [Rhizobiaceae bacterium]|nr:SAM-dependent methyltransferase [Rhizobiaceae bacterium]
MNAVVPFAEQNLVDLVDHARKLLDRGDVALARVLSAGAYEQAKAAAKFGEKFGAAKQLVSKARQLQGEALKIETRSKILLAEEWDAAQASGQASKGGRPKTVIRDNGFTSAEAGLSREEIHEARKLAAAEKKSPGIVERAIAARLDAGLEPTRANLSHAIGTRSATRAERGNNLYETPIEAMHTLLALETFLPFVADFACGRGAIARPLEDAGYDVHLADLVDYGTHDKDGVVQEVQDFLTTRRDRRRKKRDFVMNPPYGEVHNAFIAHALREHQPDKMALLLNLNVLCGFEDPDRCFIMDENPPARIYVFTRRLPMMHRDGWDGKKASSQMNTAWFVWERRGDGYAGDTIIKRVDWKDFLPTKQGDSA